MPGGRPRKASSIRELEGNRSRREIPPDLPLSGVPICPPELSGKAREHFLFIAGELTAVSVGKSLDTAALVMLATLWAEYMAAVEGHDWKAMSALSSKWQSLAGQLGITPAARAKLMATPAAKPDPLEEKFLKITG